MRASPRILCVVETIGRAGGAEQLLVSLLPKMRAVGVDLEVVALFDWPQELTGFEEQGIVVHRLGIAGPKTFISGMTKLWPVIRKGRYDIFWGHLLLGNIYARVAQFLTPKSKLVITLHSKDVRGSKPNRRYRFARLAERLLLRRADAKVAVSDALSADYSREFGWSDVQTIHNGVDVSRIEVLSRQVVIQDVRSLYGAAQSALLLVTPARFVELKGHVYLFEAVRELIDQGSEVVLVLCGEGPLEQSLRHHVARLGISKNVRFAGVLDHRELIPLMASADAVVMPSLYESFGLVPVEALAAATRVVATKVEGFTEVLSHCPSASLVEPASALALTSAIASLSQRNSGNGSSRTFARRFDIETCASRWLTLFDQVSEGMMK